MKNKILLLIVISLSLFAGCNENEDTNPVDPRLLTSENIIESTGLLINKWFRAAHNANGPAMSLWGASDAGTCSWGGSGQAYYLSKEPREVYNNTNSMPYDISYSFYYSMYNVLNSTNDILYNTKIKNRKVYIAEVEITEAVNAFAYFAQGLSLGYLGLLYDKAFIVTENTDLDKEIPVSSYPDLINASLESFDKSIEICNTKTFSIPDSWIPGLTLNQETLGKIVNSFAARILAYSPRNKSENENIDWIKVYNYASKGINFDFAPIADDINWYTSYHSYANYSGWGRADMRIVNMMDPDMPDRWHIFETSLTDSTGYEFIPDPKSTIEEVYDDRLISDFQFLSSCSFYPERGWYFFSCYRFKRRDQYLQTWTEPIPEMYKTENDLLIAEAALMTNKVTEAVTIINNGTRISRGGLPEIAANKTEIEEAIFHERNIELFCSGLGIEYFTMRKADKLQYGTVLHFPIPGQELEILGMDYYTFGPGVGIAGEDYSVGGWD